MSDGYNVRVCAFGDADLCQRAIESVPSHVAIHVCDGRYATFDGETNLTPGLKALCETYSNVHYHAPNPDRLPFGHELLEQGVPLEWRPGNHAKAKWIDEVVPQNEWTLKLDTDEVLTRFDIDLSELDRKKRYVPLVNLHGQRKQSVHLARLWVPKHWTRWIDDCLLPNEIIPRSTPLECLQRIWRNDEWAAIRFFRRSQTTAIEIDNYGADRPLEYQQRRADHLKRIGRDDRWTELKAEL